MAATLTFDPDLEWLDHAQPVGLVIAPSLVKELGLTPALQTQADTAEVAELLTDDPDRPDLADPWVFAERVLGWPASRVAGAPGGPSLPEALVVRLPEYDTTLEPHWAVMAAGAAEGWQLLVRIEPPGVEPDTRGALGGWEATPHQRFERLLRDTGVAAGLLITDRELRLVHAPKGETSGWQSFPLRPLGTVSGRPMLGGLKLVLGAFRLFNDAEPRRLPALLRRSREAQAAVSTALAEQVLGALHELLRGLNAAEPALVADLAAHRPGHLYEGLLTVLMRLVFILYAEDRDLLPSRADAGARAFYQQGYALRSLHARLLEDAARWPDTMEERLGAWGRLAVLFRLIHAGDGSSWIRGRGGKLFDPDAFPFLEGRADAAAPARVPRVTDGCVLRLLDGLVNLKGERLSYRTLDVEQIGSVYETVMGFTVERASGPALAIRAGKNNRTPVFVDLAELAAAKPEERLKRLKEGAGRSQLTAKQQAAIKAAAGVDGMAAALDAIVDERGSPGRRILGAGTAILQPTDERRRTGSHYTPRSLTEPIVRHALEPAFDRLGPDARPEQVLDLKVCDPAMGSGAFLVEACRALAARLVQAWARWPAARPAIPPDEDEELHARRLVAQRCLYGVDRNPMATDLARLSLWLATLARDHEFTFLDHALKTGDSLVGLTRAQIAALHWTEGHPGLPLFRDHVAQRVAEVLKARAAIREAPDDVTRAVQEIRHTQAERDLHTARLLGDAIVAAFFTGAKPREREAARIRLEMWAGGAPVDLWRLLERQAANLSQGDHPIRPFHWELEFPEVFARDNPGFDAVVGNPPFLAGTQISAELGDAYRDWLKTLHTGAHGYADLVAHFFRRAFTLLRGERSFGLLATKTISQGDTRTTGLTWILANGGIIADAVTRLKWPGEAAVTVSVVHVTNSGPSTATLDGKPASRISAFLIEGEIDDKPLRLSANYNLCFSGSKLCGEGFLFQEKANTQANSLAALNELRTRAPNEMGLVKPYFSTEDIADNPQFEPRRWVIDFDNMSLEEAIKFPNLFSIMQDRVLPFRQSQKNQTLKQKFWQFEGKRETLYQMMRRMPKVLITPRVSKHFYFLLARTDFIYSSMLVVVCSDDFSFFGCLQSRVHEMWVRAFGFSLEDRMGYSGTECFDTFPFPPRSSQKTSVGNAGQAYEVQRRELMTTHREGPTKTYNRFHSAREKAPDIQRLRELHDAVDHAVLRAYGWEDLAVRAVPQFLDETNEDDHKYQGRYFWPAELRDEVLARLLTLNAERAAEEQARGLAPRRGQTRTDEDELEEV